MQRRRNWKGQSPRWEEMIENLFHLKVRAEQIDVLLLGVGLSDRIFRPIIEPHDFIHIRVLHDLFTPAPFEAATKLSKDQPSIAQHRPERDKHIAVIDRNHRGAAGAQHPRDFTHAGLGIRGMMNHTLAIYMAERCVLEGHRFGVLLAGLYLQIINLRALLHQGHSLRRQIGRCDMFSAAFQKFNRPHARTTAQIQHTLFIALLRKKVIWQISCKAVIDHHLSVMFKKGPRAGFKLGFASKERIGFPKVFYVRDGLILRHARSHLLGFRQCCLCSAQR